MKKTIVIATIFLGLFLFVGISFASDVETLQPASTITYNEDLTVNGTGRFDSIYVGKQGVGGVTFFNGTIVNSTIGEGESDNPVTFGDQVRIDGLIYGGPNMGNVNDQALKIADTLLPGLTNANDLGSSNLKWKDLYLAGALNAKNINYSNLLSGKDIKLTGNLDGNSAKFTGLIEAQNFAWNIEKNYIMSINASGCVGTNITNNMSYCESTAPALIFFKAYWPISIDDKAKIKSFSAKIYDNQAADVACNLVKNSVSGTAPSVAVVIKSITTSDSLGWTTIKAEDINETVDNDKHSYSIYCQNIGAHDISNAHLISGFKIEYSKSSPD